MAFAGRYSMESLVCDGREGIDDEDEGKEEELIIDYIMNELTDDRNCSFGIFSNFKKRRRVESKTTDFENTKWGRLINDQAVKDSNTWQGKMFRRRFRVPFPLFSDVLIPLCKDHNLFDTVRVSRIPPEMKLMCVLRMLGRRTLADDIAEMTDIGETTANILFKKVLVNMAERVYSLVVKVPSGEYLGKILKVSAALGLPGMIGSMDCTHLRWTQCPAKWTVMCKGKEAYPTLSFQAIVSHDRMIWHVSNWNFGRNNDITVTRCDTVPNQVRRGLFKDVEFTMMDSDSVSRICRGKHDDHLCIVLYLILIR